MSIHKTQKYVPLDPDICSYCAEIKAYRESISVELYADIYPSAHHVILFRNIGVRGQAQGNRHSTCPAGLYYESRRRRQLNQMDLVREGVNA